MSKELTVFEFQGHRIRVIEHNGEPWFVGNEVCAVLGIANAKDAISRLFDHQKSGVGIADPHGRVQNTNIISEGGMYKLAFRSNKKEAEDFTNKVADEILPSIRKTGSYSIPNQGNTKPQFNFKYQERLSLNKNVRIYGYIPAIKFLDDINIQFLEDVITLSDTSSPDISLGQFFAKRLPLEPWYDVNLVRKPVGGTDKRKWDQDIVMTVYVKDGYQVKRQVTHFPIEWYGPIWHIVQTEYFPDLFPKYLAGKNKSSGIARCSDEELQKYITGRVNYFIDRAS